ncbi:MAG TPA: efflux RND transporter periplasmic adaptor subunit [Myxococcales bacterium]|nr:efflux RND transporter periplasmic adaptor subunit [Myxococcales bacterium]
MIGRIVRIVAALAVAAGAFVGYQAWAQREAHRPIEWSGTVEARTIEIGSRVGGRIKDVLVREGDQVKAAQPLIVLEPGDLEAQKIQAEGQVEQAEANLEKVVLRGGSARRQEILAAEARLKAEEVAIDKAEMDLRRNKQLLGGGAATQTDVDNSDIAVRNANAQRDAQKASLDELLQGTPQDVKAAQGQLDAARGKVEQIQTQLEELTIRAPRAALVQTLDLRPGDILAPDQVAAKLLEPDQLYVRIYVPETQLGLIRPGQELPVYVDTFPGRAFRSAVEYVSDEGEFTPRNLQTEDERADQVFASRLRIEDGRDVLRAGMAAFTRIPR